MKTTSMKMLVVLAAVVACGAACQWISLASPARAGALWCDEDPNGPDPVPAPEVAGLGAWFDDDPNGPEPVPPPEIVGIAPSIPLDDDPNEPAPPPEIV